MPHIPIRPTLILLALGVAGCTTPTAPVAVTRFHLGAPVTRGTISVEPQLGTDTGSLEFRTYMAAVGRELSRIGYSDVTGGQRSDFVALVGYDRNFRPSAVPRRSPVSIGVGGGTGGVGLGIGFGLGSGRRPADTVSTQLRVQIKRRSNGEVFWEGRAQTEARERTPAAQPGMAADRLAMALFKDFPGESGRTINVP